MGKIQIHKVNFIFNHTHKNLWQGCFLDLQKMILTFIWENTQECKVKSDLEMKSFKTHHTNISMEYIVQVIKATCYMYQVKKTAIKQNQEYKNRPKYVCTYRQSIRSFKSVGKELITQQMVWGKLAKHLESNCKYQAHTTP